LEQDRPRGRGGVAVSAGVARAADLTLTRPYDQAAAAGRQVALNRYNEACCFALGGKPDAALDAVEKSLAVDPEQVTGMKGDGDLASLSVNRG
jgi:hypothetical protein